MTYVWILVTAVNYGTLWDPQPNVVGHAFNSRAECGQFMIDEASAWKKHGYEIDYSMSSEMYPAIEIKDDSFIRTMKCVEVDKY